MKKTNVVTTRFKLSIRFSIVGMLCSQMLFVHLHLKCETKKCVNAVTKFIFICLLQYFNGTFTEISSIMTIQLLMTILTLSAPTTRHDNSADLLRIMKASIGSTRKTGRASRLSEFDLSFFNCPAISTEFNEADGFFVGKTEGVVAPGNESSSLLLLPGKMGLVGTFSHHLSVVCNNWSAS